MRQLELLPNCSIPEDGLNYFYSLLVWVEKSKKAKVHRVEWKKGQKDLTKLSCIKFPKVSFKVPQEMEDNTLYIPLYSSGYYAICQLRHAFCHADMTYDTVSRQYEIHKTKKINVAGRFSLDAIKEFVSVYIQPTQRKQTK